MFGWFSPPPFFDPELGELVRRGGRWRGSLRLDSGLTVSLALSGPRKGPDPESLAAARAIPGVMPSWREDIERALFEHYRPYAEAGGEEWPRDEDLPAIATADQIWPYVKFVHLGVGPLDGELTTELGLSVAWDEEHTLGARFRSGKFVELCGSVLAP